MQRAVNTDVLPDERKIMLLRRADMVSIAPTMTPLTGGHADEERPR
jgi:hypothetical protein